MKNKTEIIKELTDFVGESLSPEAKALTEKITVVQKDVDYRKLILRGGNKVTYDFSDYKTLNGLFRDLYYKNMTINDAEMKQDKFNTMRVALSNYSPKDKKYMEAKNSLLNNAKNFYEEREKIIEGFKEAIFSIKPDDEFKQQTSEKPIKTDANAFNEWINKEETAINEGLFKKHFNFHRPGSMLKDPYQINDKEKNNKLVSVINSGLKNVKKEVKEMSQEEKEIEKPDELVEIVDKMLKFNKQIQQ